MGPAFGCWTSWTSPRYLTCGCFEAIGKCQAPIPKETDEPKQTHVHRALHVVDGTVRNPTALQDISPLVRVLLRKYLLNHRNQHRAVLHTKRIAAKHRVARHLGLAQTFHEDLPLTLVARRDDHVGVLCFEGLVRNDSDMTGSPAGGFFSGDEVVGGDVGQRGNLRFGGSSVRSDFRPSTSLSPQSHLALNKVNVNPLSCPRLLTLQKGSHDGTVGKQSSREIGDGHADLYRRAVILSGNVH